MQGDEIPRIKLNEYSFAEIRIGQTESFNITMTQDMQDGFRALSGDINPMHLDEAYAKSKGFDGKLVYGMLTASFYSTLVGTLLPGKKCLLQEVEIKFRKPVLIGDVLRVVGECTEKNDTFKLIIMKAKVSNQSNELVSSAKLKVSILD